MIWVESASTRNLHNPFSDKTLIIFFFSLVLNYNSDNAISQRTFPTYAKSKQTETSRQSFANFPSALPLQIKNRWYSQSTPSTNISATWRSPIPFLVAKPRIPATLHCDPTHLSNPKQERASREIQAGFDPKLLGLPWIRKDGLIFKTRWITTKFRAVQRKNIL